jgi:hypothetical protein
MPGRGGIMVYVNKVCEATYLEEFQSEQVSVFIKTFSVTNAAAAKQAVACTINM